MKGKIGSACTIQDFRARHDAWEKTGNAKCRDCQHLRLGNYCLAKKHTIGYPDKIFHCKKFKKIGAKKVVKKVNKNGYNPSIMDTAQGEDYLYKTENVQTIRHELFYGNANRNISKANGFWINITPQTHEMIHHTSKGGTIANQLRKQCQAIFEDKHSREDFMGLIGRNYL